MNIEPMDEELRALIALEKGAASDVGDARGRLEARLAPLFAAHAAITATAAAAATSASASQVGSGVASHVGSGVAASIGRVFRWPALALATAGGVAVGAAGTAVVSRIAPTEQAPRVEIRYVERVVEVEKVIDAGPSVDVWELPSAPAPQAKAPAAPSAPAQAAPTAEGSDQALARERQLIDKERSALARHDAEAALLAADEHARAFPKGQLVEMREALAVQALVQTGRNPEARSRAARFHARFPGSLYAPVVDRAISSIP